MPQQTSKKDKIGFGVAVLVIGAGVGWLAGLSVSPVVGIIITSVTGSAAAIIAVLAGIDARNDKSDIATGSNDSGESHRDGVVLLNRRPRVSPVPLMLFVIGIVAGSALGISARNNGVLGSGPSIAVDEWVRAGLVEPDWPRKRIVERLFESTVFTNTASGGATLSPFLGSVLFAEGSAGNTIPECVLLLTASQLADDDLLRQQLRSLSDKRLAILPDIIVDSHELQSFVEQVLCARP